MMKINLYKILSRRSIISFLLVVAALTIFTPSYMALADENSRVYDRANLLSASELQDLEELSLEYQEEVGVEIYILTHDDSRTPSPESYIEDFDDLLPFSDRVYFLYDVYRGEIFMAGYGKAETYIHSRRIDAIMDEMVADLKKDNYYDAFVTYIKMSADYMLDDSDLNYDHNYDYDKMPESSYDYNNQYSYDDYDYGRSPDTSTREDAFRNPFLQLIVSFIIGGIVVAIMASNSGGRMTANSNNYINPGQSGLIGRGDQYIRTVVTRTRRPKQNTSSTGGRSGGFSSGGSRGGVSRGGRSHSSGGRKL